MYKLRDKLQVVLKQLDNGGELKLKTGHILVIPEGYEEPGFKATRSGKDIATEDVVLQIGSDVAWMFLIQHVKDMTREDCIQFILDNVNLNEIRRGVRRT